MMYKLLITNTGIADRARNLEKICRIRHMNESINEI